jgi:hypothetical protein
MEANKVGVEILRVLIAQLVAIKPPYAVVNR